MIRFGRGGVRFWVYYGTVQSEPFPHLVHLKVENGRSVKRSVGFLSFFSDMPFFIATLHIGCRMFAVAFQVGVRGQMGRFMHLSCVG
jgi:hypothetical protein